MTDELDGVPVETSFYYIEGLLERQFARARLAEELARTGESAHLLHLEHKLIDRPSLWGELSSITHRHRSSNIRGVAFPFTASVDKENLWVELLCFSMSEVVLVLVVVWLDRAPCEFPVIATIVQRRRTSRSCNDG